MKLSLWYKIHAACTIPFAIPMVLAPQWTLELLDNGSPGGLADDLARLVGAAYLLITMITWRAASLDRSPQIVLAQVFCVYETIGLLISIAMDDAQVGAVGRWLAIVFFAIFAVGYAWFGFVEPRRPSESSVRS